MHADDLVLWGKSEEDLTAMVGRFVDVCRRRGMKVNAGESNLMIISGEKGLESEVHVDGVH